MKILILFLFSSFLHAQTSSELERLNFFPRVRSFAVLGYGYTTKVIEAPASAVESRKVNDRINNLNLSYAYSFWNRTFLGLTIGAEEARESGVQYGIATTRRYNSSGFKDPELFFLWRLQEQGKKRGIIDVKVNFLQGLGAREVCCSSSNRLEGGNVYSLELSHGKWEDEWEFKTSLGVSAYGKGEEHNDFTKKNYSLDSGQVARFMFQAQHRLKHQYFVYAGIGAEYSTERKIYESGPEGEKREIQGGTGSIFRGGLKFSFSNKVLLSAGYELKRSDYFVKSGTNFDGDLTLHRFQSSLSYGF